MYASTNVRNCILDACICMYICRHTFVCMTVCTYYLHWQPLHTENLFVHISSISVNKVFGCLKHFIFNDFALCSRFHCTFVCVCVCASLQVRTSLHNVITSIYVYVCVCVCHPVLLDLHTVVRINKLLFFQKEDLWFSK